MGILLCEQNFRNVWIRNESVRAEIGQILQTDTHPHNCGKISSKVGVVVMVLVVVGCGSGYMVVFRVFAGEALMSIQLVVDYSSSSSSSSTTTT